MFMLSAFLSCQKGDLSEFTRLGLEIKKTKLKTQQGL